MKYIDKILAYMKQPSTWRGIIGIFTAFGLLISDEQKEAIVSLAIVLIGLVEILRNES